ncbi:hypothetical protein [Empedobacter brevis]|uniref:hypothetical protein n=1 Tax=Empedobacter brevis TaxID=247 RepID=UPI00333EF24F
MLIHFTQSICDLRLQLINPTSSTTVTQQNYAIIKEFVNESIFNINKSLIEGEYIVLDIEDEINLITNDLSDLELDYPNYLDFKKFLDAVRNALNKYLAFVNRIKNIYGLKIIDFSNTTKSVKSVSYNELKLLDLNIKLNILDNDFTSSKRTIINLFNTKNELNLITVNSLHSNIHTALITKVEFLSYKWYLRTAQKEQNTQYNNVLVNIRARIPNNLFNDWIDKTLNHYEITGQNWVSYFITKYENLKAIPNNQLTFLQINDKIKYLKDVSKEIKELELLLNDVEQNTSQSTSSTELEKKTLGLLINYIINNYFSLYCDKKNEEFKIIKNKDTNNLLKSTKVIVGEIIEKYKDLETRTKNDSKNFFLAYKAALYCTTILNEAYELCDEKQKFIEVNYDDITNHISNIIENYKTKIDWSLLNNNYIFKLDYGSSRISHNHLNVYYASSFTLAKVDNDIQNRFKEVEDQYRDLKLRITLKDEITSISNLNNEFKKENKRLIEIVGAFTAIISFIVGSIGAFEFIKTFYQAVLFLSIFGFAISSFVIIIFAATRGVEMFKKNWYVFIPYGVLLVIIGILTFYNTDELKFPEKDIEKIEKKYNKKLDSIQKINTKKVDDLIKIQKVKK